MTKLDFNIENYNYTLPEEKIAKHPLSKRDASKLLFWDRGDISHQQFQNTPELIAENSLLVFNDTKVISARLLFQKSSGARIELFLLNPEHPTRDIQESMALKETTVWQCMVGNKKKWKEGTLIKGVGDATLKASYHDSTNNLVRFTWTGNDSFADIVNKSGETPLPPYLKRKPVSEDSERYQTVYSRNDGAVAAPTAGLHFTKEIIRQFQHKNVRQEYLTLHVSAGTFKPVEASDFRDHDMHREQIVLHRKSIENLIARHDQIIAVGTTSLRILESIYWFGALLKKNAGAPFSISKELPYQLKTEISYPDALKEVSNHFDRNHLAELHGETEIFIYPGYRIRSAKGLFTNFHLPKSTLLLLISVFVNGDWKRIYDEALCQNYRFLSYGDSSLLLR
jgi:S-adenosylmethionine:tRNA ribosyltransferase-isomerase